MITQDDFLDALNSASERRSVALEALTLVYGPRQNDYGPVVSCFTRCAAIMNVIKDKTDENIYTGKQIALLMMAMKLARRQFKYKRDNNVDLIGYTDLLEVFEEQEESGRVPSGAEGAGYSLQQPQQLQKRPPPQWPQKRKQQQKAKRK